jgi:hypothetical protein
MHNEFADWYRTASVDLPEGFLTQRWQGVEEAANGLTSEQIIALVRLFAIRPAVGVKTPEFLDAAFRKYDVGFPTRDHLQELRVLAGAVLRIAIENGRAAGIAAAAGMGCATFGVRYQALPNKEHVDFARKFLTKRATEIRAGTIPIAKVKALSSERLEELLPAQMFTPNQTPNMRAPLFDAIVEQSKAIQAGDSILSALKIALQSQREELNLLWWLQVEFSRDLSRPFSQLRHTAAACILPFELADLTLFVPGSTAIFGILVSALAQTSGAVCSIQQGINATPRDWRAGRVGQQENPVDVLCPIAFAMAKSLETDGEDDWVPVYKKFCDVQIDESLETRDIAYQIYSECIFDRALTEMGK